MKYLAFTVARIVFQIIKTLQPPHSCISRDLLAHKRHSITTHTCRHIYKLETERSRQASSLRGHEREELAL